VTAGPSDDPTTTAVEANAARQDGAHIFVVNVGPFASRTQLQNIASKPWTDFTFIVEDDSTQSLASVADQLAASICNCK